MTTDLVGLNATWREYHHRSQRYVYAIGRIAAVTRGAQAWLVLIKRDSGDLVEKIHHEITVVSYGRAREIRRNIARRKR